jgi:hypothetical protein
MHEDLDFGCVLQMHAIVYQVQASIVAEIHTIQFVGGTTQPTKMNGNSTKYLF